jgi:hypothetical protein
MPANADRLVFVRISYRLATLLLLQNLDNLL